LPRRESVSGSWERQIAIPQAVTSAPTTRLKASLTGELKTMSSMPWKMATTY